MTTSEAIFLFIAAIPFIYYLIALYSSVQFFRVSRRYSRQNSDFTPPVSILKPVRGLDPEAYENFASFCRQDYPDYEILFCAGENDPVLRLLENLKRDFPTRRIRIMEGSGRDATNDKVAKLGRLVSHADHEVLVISDSDVRVRPDYLRSVVSPLGDSKVGGATCLYNSLHDDTLTQKLQSIGMISDFYPGIVTAWQLDGVEFTLGPTIVTTKAKIAGFGGFREIENRPADDLLVGRLIAEQGYKVELLPYVVETVADFQSFGDLVHKRIRWMTVMRHMRRWGHLGLIFTVGLPWSIAAVAVHPSLLVALTYLGSYAALRLALAWVIGVWGMKQRNMWRAMSLIPLWDAMAFLIWLISFVRKTIRWRDIDYYITDRKLVPVGRTQRRRKTLLALPRAPHGDA